MVDSRTATAVVGLLAGLALSVVIYLATGWLLVFLVVPFVPFLFSNAFGDDADDGELTKVRHCPHCEFRTSDPEHEYCPRDGHRLRER